MCTCKEYDQDYKVSAERRDWISFIFQQRDNVQTEILLGRWGEQERWGPVKGGGGVVCQCRATCSAVRTAERTGKKM